MTNKVMEAQRQWDAFLAEWTEPRLRDLSLDEYYGSEGDKSFFSWIRDHTNQLGEFREEPLGAGVRPRVKSATNQPGSGIQVDDHYIWYSILGSSAAEAFENLKRELLVAIEAVRNSDLSSIGVLKRAPGALVWKVAFLYQDQNKPLLLPFYTEKQLKKVALDLAGNKILLQQQLMARRGDEALLDYADRLWAKANEYVLPPDEVQEMLARFASDPRLANSLHSDEERWLFCHLARAVHQQGWDWWTVNLDQAGSIRFGRRDLGEKKATAVLGQMNPRQDGLYVCLNTRLADTDGWQPMSGVLVAQIEQEDFAAECYAEHSVDRSGRWPTDYLGNSGKPVDKTQESEESARVSIGQPALNQILYGPPGTGKTYATIDAALEILDPEYLKAHREDRATLKAHFDELAATGQVRLVTFHQSFSYEDFVEGLRAVSNDDSQLEYKVEPGVFKRLCDDARTQGTEADTGIRSNPRIWKISIDGTGTSPTKTYCLDKGEARIGWGQTGDLLQTLEGSAYYQKLGSGDKGTLRYFAEEMAIGDILLCIHSADSINAIGVVTGNYRFEQVAPAGVIANYQHVRAVKWLYRDLKLPILPLNDNKQFTLKTVYQMDRFTWGDLLAHLEKSNVKLAKQSVATAERKPHVLVIDEINRGNVSRIFGELITLIEPSKRDGADEALSAELPYSKKPFSVPDNVYLIGTMNTADRSLAGLDIALRRRFTFREMPPRPELLDKVVVAGVNIGQLLRVMNQRIEVLLDRDHCLGHAYFMPLESDPSLARMESIFRNQVLPLLQEYFFEDWQRIQWVLNDHRKAAPDCFVSQRQNDVQVLFGNGVEVSAHNLPWSINEDAFQRVTAYAGIVSVQAKLETPAEVLEAAEA